MPRRRQNVDFRIHRIFLTMVRESLTSRQKLLHAKIKTQKKRHAAKIELDQVKQLTLRAVYLDLVSVIDHELQIAVLPKWREDSEGDWAKYRAKHPPEMNAEKLAKWWEAGTRKLKRNDVSFLTFGELSTLFQQRFGVELSALPGGRSVEKLRTVANILKHKRGFEHATISTLVGCSPSDLIGSSPSDFEPLKLRIDGAYRHVSDVEAFIVKIREIAASVGERPANSGSRRRGPDAHAPRLRPKR